jgi:hypothetical protein
MVKRRLKRLRRCVSKFRTEIPYFQHTVFDFLMWNKKQAKDQGYPIDLQA